MLFLLVVRCGVAQNSNAADGSSRRAVVTLSPAIAPGVFHLVVNALPVAPAASPFIVAPGESVQPPTGGHLSGTLTGSSQNTSNPLILKSAEGKPLLTLKAVDSNGVSITFTFEHDPQDRFYGNGNESENHAGPLMHTSGKQVVNNGTTCVPFIWSASGYGILIANSIHDIKRHITWSDLDGTLAWVVPERFADVYLMAPHDGPGVLGAYARLTGAAPIPPCATRGVMSPAGAHYRD